MNHLLTVLLILMRLSCLSQTHLDTYHQFKKQADSLYQKGLYAEAGHTYTQAFQSLNGKGYPADRYSAACCWALDRKPDSAFLQLDNLSIKQNFKEIEKLSADKDLVSLHTDPRWPTLLKCVRKNFEKAEAGINRALLHEVDSLKKEDQKWRTALTECENQRVVDSVRSKEMWAKIRLTDSLNYPALKHIWERYCYPNTDLLGEEGSHNFWLLMQHQDKHPDFQEEVLAGMKRETDRGKASLRDYAYLVDRVKVNKGQLQIYGTQMIPNADHSSYEPKPVVEPEKLNERRTSIGLPSIQEYIEIMNSHYSGTLTTKKMINQDHGPDPKR
jgi:hypothetical protein